MIQTKFEVNLENPLSIADTLDRLLANIGALCETAVEKNGIETGLRYGVYKDGNFIEHTCKVHDRIPLYSELAFFLQSAKNTANTNKILKYVQFIMAKNKVEKVWLDDEMPMGLNASFSLAYTNKEYISDFINFLRTVDMNHEVYQVYFIKILLNRWGICDPILKLLAARAGSISGQFGLEGCDIPSLSDDQKKAFFEYLLKDSLSARAVFPDLLKDALDQLGVVVTKDKFNRLFNRYNPIFSLTNIPDLNNVK